MTGLSLIGMAAKCGVFVDKNHDKLPMRYWLSKLHKRPYKDYINFSANSRSCTTTGLSIILTFCLTTTQIYKIEKKIYNEW